MPWAPLQAAWSVVKWLWNLAASVLRLIPWWAWFWLFIATAAWSVLYGNSRYAAGQAERQGLWDAATAEQNQRIRELEAKVDTATAVVEVRTVDKIKEIHVKGDTIIRRIPQLIPAGACDLPVGFRRVHDDASGHEVSDSTASAD